MPHFFHALLYCPITNVAVFQTELYCTCLSNCHLSDTFVLLTFKNRASYIHCIGRAYRYPPDVAFYIHISTTISTEYFKHAAHSPFFSSKCRLFHNAAFLVHVLFTFYIQGALKFKCKTPVTKG
jgi:hypothetical protein